MTSCRDSVLKNDRRQHCGARGNVCQFDAENWKKATQLIDDLPSKCPALPMFKPPYVPCLPGTKEGRKRSATENSTLKIKVSRVAVGELGRGEMQNDQAVEVLNGVQLV